jgi:hypothetical protein
MSKHRSKYRPARLLPSSPRASAKCPLFKSAGPGSPGNPGPGK